MKYLADSRLTQLTSDLTGAFLNTRSVSGDGRITHSQTRQGKQRGKRGGRGGHAQTARSAGARSKAASPTKALYTYNPAGYSAYGNNSNASASPSSSSSRVIYGRVEAYTTKRTGSDKKTAVEVGERYAHEMERLNEAVENLKKQHREKMQQDGDPESGGEMVTSGEENAKADELRERKIERRRIRSCSVDAGVTFANEISAPMRTITEGKASVTAAGGETDHNEATSSAKRNLPLEGILKQPPLPSSKRCRATSFDVSTGPNSHYHHSESSLSLLAGGSNWGESSTSIAHVAPGIANYDMEDRYTQALIPQQSIYQSSNHHNHSTGGKPSTLSGPAMAPRRLVTDLILTLNASFPDYDFSATQVSDFCTLETSEAMRRINDRLGEFASTTDRGRDFIPRFWTAMEDISGGLRECEVYSYAPAGRCGEEDDPLEFLTRSLADDENGVEDNIGTSEHEGDDIVTSLADDGVDTSMLDSLSAQVSPLSSADQPHVTLWSMNYFFVSRNKKRIVLFACVETVRSPQGQGGYDSYDGEYDDYGENNPVFDEARRGIQKQEEDELQQQRESTSDTSYLTSARFGNTAVIGSSSADGASVMVEDTDVDEGVDIGDADVNEAHGENDFDTGTLSVPSEVA